MAIPNYSNINPLAALGVQTSGQADSAVGATPYDFTSLKYPQDLGDPVGMNGHYVNFYVNVHKMSSFFTGGSYTYTNAQGTNYTYSETSVPAGGGSSGLSGGIKDLTYSRISQAISLYIPDSVNVSQSIEWGEASVMKHGMSLLQGAADLIGGGARSGADAIAKASRKNTMKSVSSKIAGAASDVAGAAGFAMNPQLLVLFRGIGFRTFQYDFMFTPRNSDEAASVRNIIKAFRFHSHPELADKYGVFYVAPSTFDIEFMHKGPLDAPISATGIVGNRNTNIHQVKTCVLTNYSVDYAPFGWSTYTDGMPVQTRLSLQFMETNIITKEEIKSGF